MSPLYRRRAAITSLFPNTELTARTTSTSIRWEESPSPLRTMTSLSLRAGTTMRGSCAIPALPPYGLLPVMLAYNLGIIDSTRDELASRMAVYIAALTSD